MAKAMIFIDGSWLYANQFLLSKKYGENYRLDYGKLPKVLGEEISKSMGVTTIDIVRTFLFGSNAVNYHTDDEQLVQNRKDFYDLLKEEYHYEVEVFDINYRGKRLRKSDRDPDDEFHPQEKCVDIALASTILYYAAIPYAYDIAIAVIGDRDFIPVLQYVRKLGKRVAVAGIRESCAAEYADPTDQYRLKDFDIIWLGDLLDRLELKIAKRRLECQSPFHKGDRFVYTDEFLRKGRKYYCPECKEQFRQVKTEQRNNSFPEILPKPSGNSGNSKAWGEIKSLIDKVENKFGFIKTDDGDYYFHITDLMKDLNFQNLKIGDSVKFDIVNPPNPLNREKPSGRASNITLIDISEIKAEDFTSTSYNTEEEII